MRVDELIDTLQSLNKQNESSLSLPVIFKIVPGFLSKREITEIKYVAGYSDRIEIQL